MNMRHSLLALAFGAVLGGSAIAAAPLSGPEAEDLLERNGFTEVSQLDYQNGAWIGTARNRDGDVVDVRIDPIKRSVTWSGDTKTQTTITTTSTVEPVRIARAETPVVVEEVPIVRKPVVVEQRVLVPVGHRIGKREVREVLVASGYHDIHDIDWSHRHHVWEAKARDPSGDDMEIQVDPVDGSILHVEDD